jgi:hypothetical protein
VGVATVAPRLGAAARRLRGRRPHMGFNPSGVHFALLMVALAVIIAILLFA